MRRSIDDQPLTHAELPKGSDDVAEVSWAVAICDDYDDARPHVVLTVEQLGHAGEGLAAHLSPSHARRLVRALTDALREIGEPIANPTTTPTTKEHV